MLEHSHPSLLPAKLRRAVLHTHMPVSSPLCQSRLLPPTLYPMCQHTQAYDSGDGMFAARLWWLLTVAGHPAAFVLEGGW